MATVASDGRRRVLAAVDAAAQAGGLAPGMPVVQAQAMSLELAVVEAEPEADSAALARLAAWCLRYAPLVALDPPDGIAIEIAGAAHLHGGEAGLLGDLTGRIRRGGFAVRATLAGTPAAAWGLARFGEPRIVPQGGEASALAELPVRALRLPPETVEALTGLGIARIGQLIAAFTNTRAPMPRAAMPRAPWRRRFGEPVTRRLDQALGRAPEPLVYIEPPEPVRVHRAFAEPLGTVEVLARVVADLALPLCALLERRGLGARRLDLVCRRVDGLAEALSVGTARPSRDPRHLARLFAERLGTIDPGFGIEAMALIAGRVEPLAARQLGLHADAPADEAAMAELVDRLALRLGGPSVFRAAAVEGRFPERLVRRVAALAPVSGTGWPEGLPRPAHLLDPPEPVEVIAALPDAPPALFVWRGRRHRVVQADGPERLTGEWWRSRSEVMACRDYYRVEDATGARFRLFRDAPAAEGGRWWLHGLGEA